jgi:hypothetical protein
VLIARRKRRRRAQRAVPSREEWIGRAAHAEQRLGALVERPQLLVADRPALGQARAVGLREVRARREIGRREALERRGIEERGAAGAAAERREEIDLAEARPALQAQRPLPGAQARLR